MCCLAGRRESVKTEEGCHGKRGDFPSVIGCDKKESPSQWCLVQSPNFLSRRTFLAPVVLPVGFHNVNASMKKIQAAL